MQSKNQTPTIDNQKIHKSHASSFNWLTATDTKTWLDERDACALVASVRKNGEATHGNLKRALCGFKYHGTSQWRSER